MDEAFGLVGLAQSLLPYLWDLCMVLLVPRVTIRVLANSKDNELRPGGLRGPLMRKEGSIARFSDRDPVNASIDKSGLVNFLLHIEGLVSTVSRSWRRSPSRA